VAGRDSAYRSVEETFEQFPNRSQQRTGGMACLVEADYRIPARIECEIAAGDYYAEPLLSRWTVRRLADSLVSQHPHLGVHDSLARRIYGDNGPLKGKRARLANRAALENWNQQPVGGQFDYRWPITQSYLADLAASMLQV
jgi:hypothetical protein